MTPLTFMETGMISRRLSFCAVLALLSACNREKPAVPEEHASATPAAQTSPAGYTYTDPRGAIFANKGCPQCHTISALGIKSTAEIGPDLTFAYEDVKNRFSMPLEQFLHNPTGTMQIVLSSQIKLDSLERDSIIHILHQLHEEGEDANKPDQGNH
jgi:hypothetical protein